MNVEIITPTITALIAAVGGYFIARRRNSGRIDTTEAGVLWEERRLLTQELREEVTKVRDDNTRMQKIIKQQAEHITTLEAKLAELEQAQ